MPEMRFVLMSMAFLLACRAPSDGGPAETDETLLDQPRHATGLQLDAYPLQTVVARDGPLLVEITLINNTDSVVTFRPIFSIGGWLNAEVIGPTGERVAKTASVDPPEAWAVTLHPGESYTDTTDLRCDVPSPNREACAAPYDLSPVGHYRITLRFFIPCYDDCRNTDPLIARPFTVKVE